MLPTQEFPVPNLINNWSFMISWLNEVVIVSFFLGSVVKSFRLSAWIHLLLNRLARRILEDPYFLFYFSGELSEITMKGPRNIIANGNKDINSGDDIPPTPTLHLNRKGPKFQNCLRSYWSLISHTDSNANIHVEPFKSGISRTLHERPDYYQYHHLNEKANINISKAI